MKILSPPQPCLSGAVRREKEHGVQFIQLTKPQVSLCQSSRIFGKILVSSVGSLGSHGSLGSYGSLGFLGSHGYHGYHWSLESLGSLG